MAFVTAGHGLVDSCDELLRGSPANDTVPALSRRQDQGLCRHPYLSGGLSSHDLALEPLPA